jgi:hypothetical protein
LGHFGETITEELVGASRRQLCRPKREDKDNTSYIQTNLDQVSETNIKAQGIFTTNL